MSTGLTPIHFLPYPVPTDPVNVSGDIQQLAEKVDEVLNETIQDTSALMWTTGGTFSNGLQAPTYNDTTAKMSMSLSQDIQTSASPTFSGITISGDVAVNGGDITSTSSIFNIINDNATTINIGGAATTTNIGNSSGQVNFAGDINLATGKIFEINNVSILSATTLGSSVVTSSLTAVGTITTGTWNATTIAVNKGGTGLTSYTIGDIVYASDTTTLAKLAGVATGSALISGGVGAAPSWGKIDLTTHVSGTLPVANGGTGITSLGSGVATWLGTPSSANLASAITDETGSGSLVFSNSPTLSGSPLAPTATFGTNTTQIATTEFVQTALSSLPSSLPSQTGNSGKYLTTDGTNASWATVDLSSKANIASPTFTGTVTTPGLTVSGGTAVISRVSSIDEGGEIQLNRSSDNTVGWTIDAYGSGSQPSFRIFDASSQVRFSINSSGNTSVVSPTAAGSIGVRQITMSTSSPTGGSDGDVWLVYA